MHLTVSGKTPKMIVQDNFKRWNDALQTKDAAAVANLYDASNLSFLPTVSPQHIKGAEDTKLYFKDFVMKNPFGTITDDSVQVCSLFHLARSGSRTLTIFPCQTGLQQRQRLPPLRPVHLRAGRIWQSHPG